MPVLATCVIPWNVSFTVNLPCSEIALPHRAGPLPEDLWGIVRYGGPVSQLFRRTCNCEFTFTALQPLAEFRSRTRERPGPERQGFIGFRTLRPTAALIGMGHNRASWCSGIVLLNCPDKVQTRWSDCINDNGECSSVAFFRIAPSALPQ
jgi:hypothetical protein